MSKIKYNDWEAVIGKNLLTVTKDGESREYDIPPHKEIKVEGQYFFITLEDDSYFQFKFEDDNFFVGDKFDKDDELIEEFACHVFAEDQEGE